MLAPTSSSSSSKRYPPSKPPTTCASRFPRACTTRRRPPPSPPPPDRRHTSRVREESNQTSRILTPLAPSPPSPSSASPSQVQRWELRSMWQFASLLNFLNVFRAVLNIGVEFSAEELETAPIAPNGTLDDVHIPLLKEELLSSKSRTESSLGKRLKIDILPEVEKIHKRKERLLKKQHRQALLLDNFATADLSSGRSVRDRKPVTYTFDDSDQSINEAIKITKKNQDSPNNIVKKEGGTKPEPSTNGRLNGTSHASQQVVYETLSPKSIEDEETDAGGNLQENNLDSRWRKIPQGYSDNYYVEASLDNYADSDSDDIVGEAVYDEDYLKVRKQKKVSSSSEGDEEYRWEENANEDEEEDLLSMSDEDTDEQHHPYKKPLTRSRRGAKSTAISNIPSGLRRSKRSTQPRIDYRQYELSVSDVESEKPDMSAGSEDSLSDASNNDMEPSENHEKEDVEEVLKVEKINEDSPHGVVEKEHCQSTIRADEIPSEGVVKERRLLDLNQLAPGTSFEDGPKDEDTDNL